MGTRAYRPSEQSDRSWHIPLPGNRWRHASYKRVLQKLTSLYLYEAAITDEGIARAGGVDEASPTAVFTRIQGHGLRSLRAGIELLDLDQTDVTDNGLADIAGLTSVQILSMRGTRITDNGVSPSGENDFTPHSQPGRHAGDR